MTNRLSDHISADDFAALIDRHTAIAHRRGEIFVYDERAQLLGDRSHARYLRELARRADMTALAERINPADYPATAAELAIDQLDATNFSAAPSA